MKMRGTFHPYLCAFAFLALVSITAMPSFTFAQEQQRQQNAGEQQFVPVAAEEWGSETALKWVNELTPDQTIEGSAVRDPQNENIVYFATSAPLEGEENGVILSVYRYDTSTQMFERLWREEHKGDGALARWHVVGVDGENVIVATMPEGADVSGCDGAIVRGLDGTDGASIKALPKTFAQSWESGLGDYTLPQEIDDRVRNEQQQCRGDQGQPEQGTEQQPADQQGEQPQDQQEQPQSEQQNPEQA